MAAYKPIARTEIQRDRRDLDELIQRAESATDLDVRADLAKYSCMRVTGFLEQALTTLGVDLVRRLSSGVPQSFALSHLDKSFNPTTEPVLKYVGRFDPAWRQELEGLLAADERGQQLNALVGTRNQIAHGRNQGIDIQRVKEHRRTVDAIVDHLLEKFAPAPR